MENFRPQNVAQGLEQYFVRALLPQSQKFHFHKTDPKIFHENANQKSQESPLRDFIWWVRRHFRYDNRVCEADFRWYQSKYVPDFQS